jgi:cyclic pyranopterin monophosphate synthase
VGADDGPRSDRRRAVHAERMARPRVTDLTNAPQRSWRAVAEAELALSGEALSAIVDGTLPKGDALGVAELAGVMGGKRTSELVPLVHPAGLSGLIVQATPDRTAGTVRFRAEAAAIAGSGVEMEAMTAAAVAALTVYDMVRDIDPSAQVRAVRLVASTGGEGGAWVRQGGAGEGFTAPRPAARSAGRIEGSYGRPAGRAPGPRRNAR